MSLTLEIPATLNEVRGATVIGYGPGVRSQILFVHIDGLDGLWTILGPPRDLPAKDSRIGVRMTADGWAHAGEAP